MPFGCQVVLRASEEQVLAKDAGSRRVFAGVLRRIGREHGLFAYGLADTHGHAALAADEPTARRFGHDVRLALRASLRWELAPLSIHPIRDVWHAETVLGYVHRQDAHHGAGLDPLREGTSLHDLSGLRPDGLWMAQRVRTLVPRVTRADLLRQWGLDALNEAFDLELLADAAAAAAGLPDLDRRVPPAVEARRAAVHLASGSRSGTVGALLGLSPRRVRELRAEPADPRYLTAVRLQIGLRQAVAVANEPLFVREPAAVYDTRTGGPVV